MDFLGSTTDERNEQGYITTLGSKCVRRSLRPSSVPPFSYPCLKAAQPFIQQGCPGEVKEIRAQPLGFSSEGRSPPD